MSISNFLEQTLLDLVFNGTAYAGQATVYVKLHTGDPGEACTSNAATETTRQSTTFGAASGGAISNDAAIALYKKAGYRTVDLWKKYYSDGEDGLVMEKILDAQHSGRQKHIPGGI